MASKYKDQNMSSRGSIPGPQDYSVNESVFSRIKGAGTIPKSRNDSFIKQTGIPGPGNYRTESSMSMKKSPSAVIGSSGRYSSTYYAKKEGPGPASYNFKEIIGKESKGPPIVPKRKDFTPRAGVITPAPGYYKSENDSALARHSFKASFGSTKRISPVRDSEKTPGPLDYYAEKMIAFKKNVPKATIGNSKRQSLTYLNYSPGPGQYLKDEKKERKGVPFVTAKRESPNTSISPGPAAYSKTDFAGFKSKRAPSMPFTTGPKFEVDTSTRKIVPGPAAYKAEEQGKLSKTMSGVSFARALRENLKKDKTPGPGDYKLPSKFADVPRYNLPQMPETARYV